MRPWPHCKLFFFSYKPDFQCISYGKSKTAYSQLILFLYYLYTIIIVTIVIKILSYRWVIHGNKSMPTSIPLYPTFFVLRIFSRRFPSFWIRSYISESVHNCEEPFGKRFPEAWIIHRTYQSINYVL